MVAAKVTAVMVVVECLSVGSDTLSKAAMVRGMSNFIFVLYNNMAGLAFLVPASFLFHRKRAPPTLTFPVFCRICLVAAICCSLQMFMTTGIRYSSPTLAAAMTDTVPAITYLLAVCCRMEKLDLRSRSSLAKFLGTALSIAGALLVTLYKGPPIVFYSSSSPSSNSSVHLLAVGLSPSNWVVGGFFLALGSVCLSLMNIVQTWIMRDYPAELIVTTVTTILIIIQSGIICLTAERDSSAWKLWSSLDLISIAYSAVFQAVIRNVVHTWSNRKQGPVYTVMFKPVGMVFAVAMGVSFLGDTLYAGSVIGAAVIALGFYGVLWGKAKEHAEANGASGGISTSDSCPRTAPLLEAKPVQV